MIHYKRDLTDDFYNDGMPCSIDGAQGVLQDSVCVLVSLPKGVSNHRREKTRLSDLLWTQAHTISDGSIPDHSDKVTDAGKTVDMVSSRTLSVFS